MTVIEQSFMNSVPNRLNEIAEQLKIANQLKAIELRAKFPECINIIDDIIKKG